MSDLPDMAELNARDPLSLSTQDLDVIIARLREQRKAWNLGNASAGRAKPAKTTKEFQAMPKIEGFDL